jgi:uncharacterized NAD(P)/FAD-binding protein YdhS
MGDYDGSPLRVAIIGAGFSGTLVAVHLLRQQRPVHIDLIDTRVPGRGLAYSTVWDEHLLNVPAVRMSAFGSEPMNFLEWLYANGKPEAPPDLFAPRKLYGTYLQDTLNQAVKNAAGKSRLSHHFSDAVGASHDGLQAHVALRNGERVSVDKIVLASGNAAPRQTALADSRYFNSPWEPGAFAGLDSDRDVLCIGAGLTAVDAFLALLSQGHRGKIHMVSRRGKLPHPHTHYRPLSEPFVPQGCTSARQLLRAIRQRVREAQVHGNDWRAVIDSLRPITNDLWQAMELVEQRRVLRHLKTWWDIHRHRMASDIGAKVAAARGTGQLRVYAGRVHKLLHRRDDLRVDVALRIGENIALDVQRVINCTGPDEDYLRLPNPFIQNLLNTGRIAPNFIGKGIQTDQYGTAIDSDGVKTEWLLAIGPPRLGGLFETTAVPELRKQAEALASYLSAVIYEPVEIPVELYIAAGI